jgi:hypothetical protein
MTDAEKRSSWSITICVAQSTLAAAFRITRHRVMSSTPWGTNSPGLERGGGHSTVDDPGEWCGLSGVLAVGILRSAPLRSLIGRYGMVDQ